MAVASGLLSLSLAAAAAAVIPGLTPHRAPLDHVTAARIPVTWGLSTQRQALWVSDEGDTYTSQAKPMMRPGGQHLLAASSQPSHGKVIFVKFRLNQIPAAAVVTSASLTLQRYGRLPVSTLSAYRVTSDGWTQGSLNAHNAPHHAGLLGHTTSSPSLDSVAFTVTQAVKHDGTYAFAITSSARHGSVRVRSREASHGPTLRIHYRLSKLVHKTPPTPTPTPTVSASASASPTATATATPSSSPSASASATPTVTPSASATPTLTPSATPTVTATPTPTLTPSATPTVTPTPTLTPSATPTVTPTPTPTKTSGCTLSSMLVPSCGVLVGGILQSFGGSNFAQQHNNFVSQTGLPMVVAHDYLRPGDVLSASDIAIAQKPGTLLQLNWKPVSTWAQANGSNASVNAQIDAMAKSIKALGSTKIMVALFHEPENDVSSGAAGCPSSVYKGGAGTPADYRAMWANVESRFNSLGVTNVVWAMNYMGYSGWNCMVDALWPGNNLVDWVLWDPYTATSNFATSVKGFYTELGSLTDASHDYTAKPWGLGEFGTSSAVDADRAAYYTNAESTLASNQFPNLKLLSVFDVNMVGCCDLRVAYDSKSQPDPGELNAFEAMANSPVVRLGNESAAGF
jgi:hypothetical protein